MAFENKQEKFNRMLQVSGESKTINELKSLIPINQSKKRYTFNLKEITHVKLTELAEQNNYNSVSSFIDDLIENIVK